MTPTDEATFIALWNAGTETAAIACQLGLKATTVQSRARRLQQRGLIQPRPRGEGYPSLRAKARGEGVDGVPRQTPGVSHGVSNRVSERVPVEVLHPSPAPSGSPEMTPLLHEILQELRTLTHGLAGRVSDLTPPVFSLTPRVSSRVSERVSAGVFLVPHEKTERWNLHLPKDLIATIKPRPRCWACTRANWWPRCCGSGWRRNISPVGPKKGETHEILSSTVRPRIGPRDHAHRPGHGWDGQ
jgi:hypothetical protein